MIILSKSVEYLTKDIVKELNETIVVLDTETTGFSPYNDRIVEFGAIKLINGEKVDSMSILINPRMHIPKRVVEVHGIDDSMVNYTYANMSGIDYIKSYNAANTDKEEEKLSNSDTILANALRNKDLIPPTWHHNGPCIPSINRLFVDVYGNFYPCEKVIEVPFSTIGNINSGIDKEKVKTFLNIGKLTEKECKKCWAMRYCNICLMFCNDVEKKQITIDKKLLACS